MNKPTLYKIYYGEHLVYLGRTKQNLRDRIRGHLFHRNSMYKSIDINLVSRIEYTELETTADMYVYEVYLINKCKPSINCSDKAYDRLTVDLPTLKWQLFETHLWDKWIQQLIELENMKNKGR